MYEDKDIEIMAACAGLQPISTVPEKGISVLIGFTAADVTSDVSTFWIDPSDEKGIALFKTFCQQMAEHYKSLNP